MSTVEREWRNRQTRTFEGRVGRLVRVQVPSLAPKNNRYHLVSVIFLCEILIFEAIILTDSKNICFYNPLNHFQLEFQRFQNYL